MTVENLNRSGIYKITCLENSKLYIGSASNIRLRWKLHRTHLRMGISHNKPMQSAWAKYGEDKFSFEVLEFCDSENLAENEQRWLDSTMAYVRDIGFNILRKAYSSIGLKHTDVVRAKLSEIALSRDHSRLRALNETRRGKPGKKGVSGWVWTDAHKKAASESRKGRPTWNKGIPQTEDAKKKISIGVTGLNRTFTESQREEVKRLRCQGLSYSKISQATGISLSHCHKINHNMTGKYRAHE